MHDIILLVVFEVVCSKNMDSSTSLYNMFFKCPVGSWPSLWVSLLSRMQARIVDNLLSSPNDVSLIFS